MKIHAMRILTVGLALLAAPTAPLAAHGEHPEASGGLLHLLLHLFGTPWAWAAVLPAAALAFLVGRRRTPPSRSGHGSFRR